MGCCATCPNAVDGSLVLEKRMVIKIDPRGKKLMRFTRESTFWAGMPLGSFITSVNALMSQIAEDEEGLLPEDDILVGFLKRQVRHKPE